MRLLLEDKATEKDCAVTSCEVIRLEMLRPDKAKLLLYLVNYS